ncbi:ABC transporter substrate-binding protein [uncultured Allofournierella sp.]|uniref:ABC transporter substrate-binding protein n=1 Tax=uncultured Allofournierella sp. TaxID=1940258 RepID=UPI00374FF608
MKKVVSFLLSLTLAFSLAACSSPASGSTSAGDSSSASASVSSSSQQDAVQAKPTTDRSGASITLPDSVGTIISMAPSITQTLLDLGCGDAIIATDVHSAKLEGVTEGLPAFEMMTPDAEQMAALNPDVVFVSSISSRDGTNPFQPLIDLGISVVCIPTSATIDDIYEDISFIGQVMGRTQEADAVNANLRSQLEEIAQLAASVPEKKTVYFEISPAPYAYSTGTGTYLDEMIQLVGGINILATADGEGGWMSVDPEIVVDANPDVIFTNVPGEGVVDEIKNRDGWNEVTAVKNGDIYLIDNNASSLPNENIVIALWEMGQALYPDVFVK